ncbi:MAG TPA: hypothetical protein VMW83_15410 [Spirochaetia bacterium]|nr:hypothetical protein [Spirochaetia bacterium]
MARSILRSIGVSVMTLALLASAAGCSLTNGASAPPDAAASSSSPDQPGATGTVSMVGEEVYHAFAVGDNQVIFTAVPTTGASNIYVGGMGQVGQLDTSPTDPTIKIVDIIFNNASANDVINVAFYDHQGNITKTIPIKTSENIDATNYNATSFQLTATTTDTVAPSPTPYAYLYQMTNSAGNIFTYTVAPPPA